MLIPSGITVTTGAWRLRPPAPEIPRATSTSKSRARRICAKDLVGFADANCIGNRRTSGIRLACVVLGFLCCTSSKATPRGYFFVWIHRTKRSFIRLGGQAAINRADMRLGLLFTWRLRIWSNCLVLVNRLAIGSGFRTTQLAANRSDVRIGVRQ